MHELFHACTRARGRVCVCVCVCVFIHPICSQHVILVQTTNMPVYYYTYHSCTILCPPGSVKFKKKSIKQFYNHSTLPRNRTHPFTTAASYRWTVVESSTRTLWFHSNTDYMFTLWCSLNGFVTVNRILLECRITQWPNHIIRDTEIFLHYAMTTIPLITL